MKKIVRMFSWLFIFMLIFSSCNRTPVIEGKVKDENIDLPGVEVVLVDNDGRKLTTFTDWYGQFNFVLDNSIELPVKLTFNRPGYKEKSLEINNLDERIEIKLLLIYNEISAFVCGLQDNFNEYNKYIQTLKRLDGLGYNRNQIKTFLDKMINERFDYLQSHFPLEEEIFEKVNDKLLYRSLVKEYQYYFPKGSKLDGPYKVSDIYGISNNFIYKVYYNNRIIGWFDFGIEIPGSSVLRIYYHSKIYINSKKEKKLVLSMSEKEIIDYLHKDSKNEPYYFDSPFEYIEIIESKLNELKNKLIWRDDDNSCPQLLKIYSIKDFMKPELYFIRYDKSGYYLLFRNKNQDKPDLIINIYEFIKDSKRGYYEFIKDSKKGYYVVKDGVEFLKDLERMRYIHRFLFNEFRKADLFSYKEHVLWFLYQQWNCESAPAPLDIRYRKYAKEVDSTRSFYEYQYMDYKPSKYDLKVIEEFKKEN